MTTDKDTKPIMPLKCLLCDDAAAVVVKADDGCTCAGNIYQPRCMHHLRRLRDSDAGCFEVVEDFRIGIMEGIIRRVHNDTEPMAEYSPEAWNRVQDYKKALTAADLSKR